MKEEGTGEDEEWAWEKKDEEEPPIIQVKMENVLEKGEVLENDTLGLRTGALQVEHEVPHRNCLL